MDTTVTFRRLTDEDLPMLHGWLNEPGIVRWWEGDDVSWDAVVRDYGSQNPDPVEHWIALDAANGTPVGWIQCWAAADEPEEVAKWAPHVDPATTAGIDYLIAAPDARGKGLGSAMIRAFVHDVVFALHPNYTQAAAAPFEANTASWRAIEKAGFTFRATIDDEDGPCRLMVIDRA